MGSSGGAPSGATVSSFSERSVGKKIRIWDLLTGRRVREWAQA